MVRLAWILFLAFQDAQEFKHDGLKVKFTVPKDWTLTQGEDDSTLAGVQKDSITGQLTHSESEASVESMAQACESAWKEMEGVTDFKILRDEKLKKSPGDHLLREYAMTYSDTPYHYAMLYVRREGSHFQLYIAGSVEDFGKEKDGILEILNSFSFTDAKEEPKKDEPKKEEPKKDEPKKDEPKSGSGGGGGQHPWDAWAEGSWVEFKTESETAGQVSVTSTKQTLVKKDAEEITVKVEGKMVKPAAMDYPASEMKIPRLGKGAMPGTATGDAKVLKQGEEELEIGGKKVKCKWVELEMTMGAGKGTQKVWTSDQVPGATVKSLTTSDMVKSTLMVTAFEGKK